MAEDDRPKRQRAPAKTLEGREGQLVNLAVDLAEQQLRKGTASSQVIVHYLKLGSTREKLEQERLRYENNLIEAKTKNLKSGEEIQELYTKAIDAMRGYSGGRSDASSDIDDYAD